MIPANFPDRNVCIVGLGYVGLTLAVVMADAGFSVHGVEVRDDVLNRLDRGEPHFWEPGLKEKLNHVVAERRLTFAKTLADDILAAVYVITVGTPLDDAGAVRIDMVENAANQVNRHLRDGALVIMRSTVKLGTTRKLVMPVLQATGKRFDIAVCPERTLEGRALVELNEVPQIVGTDDRETLLRASQIFSFLTPTILRLHSLETAEIVKLVDNTYRDVSFAFANEVARMCDATNVSAAGVIHAGKLGYPRTDVATPGPVGGPCLGKDPHIFAESARELGIELDITLASRSVNERQPPEVAARIRRLCDTLDGFPGRPSISLLGLAFKGRPATDDLRGTMARPVFAALAEQFPEAVFRGYDAVVVRSEIEAFGLTPADSLDDALDGANIAVILNNHPVFAMMALESKAALLARPGFVYDFWNLFSNRNLNLPDGTGYVALGGHVTAILPGIG